MDKCRDEFAKEPEKYAEQQAPENEHEHQASMKMNESWLQMLESTGNIPFIDVEPSGPKKRMKDAIGRPASFPGVVDWDRPNPKKEGEPPRDWTGWGKFPGAEYLGLGKGTEKKFPAEEDDASVDESMNSLEDEPADTDTVPTIKAEHPGMKDKMEELPAAAEPESPAER
jgi:hypothetical protein